MVIHKILNNNLILSRDGQGHEVIVKGCGIAFQKKKGQQVEESRIEKIFTAENAQISKEIQGYLTAIPEKYLDFVEAFVNEVKEKEGMKLKSRRESGGNEKLSFKIKKEGGLKKSENELKVEVGDFKVKLPSGELGGLKGPRSADLVPIKKRVSAVERLFIFK